MTGLSSLSRAAACAILAAAAACVTIPLAVMGAPFWGIVAACVVQLAFAIAAALSLRETRTFLTRVSDVCAAVRVGDFDQRLIFPGARGQLKTVMDRINAVIDINDAFVREAALAMGAVNEGRYYRKIRPEGMKGAFRNSVTSINAAIDSMAERQSMIEEAIAEAKRLAAAATEGDLTQRIDASRFVGEYKDFTASMNALLDTIAEPIEETGRALGALARTDLTVRMYGTYRGAFARLQQDTNAVGDKLTEVVMQLRGTSRTLKTATGEILEGANDLSERTTKQAATIEETSATMEQLAATVLENAKRAQEASINAVTITKTAEDSGQVMMKANEAMERITASSSKISNIIGMIDDIAFQTNLLALNASVEAARAGDAGKGFAVVAVEVRRLAQSAAQASSEIKALIEQSGTEVGGGSKLVAEAVAKLDSMLAAARKNYELLDGIARESREQAAAIEEVNVAVRQMDEMTQHNAALVEETNAAIEQTEAQATELDGIVDIFTIAEPSGQTAAPAPRDVKALQAKAKSAAQSYLSNGNAAVKKDWSEF